MNVPMEEPSPIDMGGQARTQNCLIFVKSNLKTPEDSHLSSGGGNKKGHKATLRV